MEYQTRVKAFVLVSTTDGAMTLDQDLASIVNQRTNAEVSAEILLESFPTGTNPQLYQPLLDRIPTSNASVLREALTSMSFFKKHGQPSAITTAPTLIMVGAKDDVATPAIAAGIRAQIAGSRLVNFETGHFMMAEDPEGFRRLEYWGSFSIHLKSKRDCRAPPHFALSHL